MIASGMNANGGNKRNGSLEHMNQYRVCKKQLQQATQQLLHPNQQQQMYIDNYLHHLAAVQQSPYRKYLNSQQQQPSTSSNQPLPPAIYHNAGKRHSNVYEYQFFNFDLNSISEDGKNES